MRRLQLIRAMVEMLEVSTEQVRKILQAADDVDRDPLLAMSEAAAALLPVNAPTANDSRVYKLPARIGFKRIIRPQGVNTDAIVEWLPTTINFCENLGVPMDEDQLKAYADAAPEMAESDFARIPEGEDAITFAVFDTVPREPVLPVMRRATHQEVGHRAASDLKESDARSFGE